MSSTIALNTTRILRVVAAFRHPQDNARCGFRKTEDIVLDAGWPHISGFVGAGAGAIAALSIVER